ncbi:hypothetical protein Jiend_52600 [Micromonospora endophytica]|nr:hypothetical protein Jiend_52600 [Micromonospora endophytica]
MRANLLAGPRGLIRVRFGHSRLPQMDDPHAGINRHRGADGAPQERTPPPCVERAPSGTYLPLYSGEPAGVDVLVTERVDGCRVIEEFDE